MLFGTVTYASERGVPSDVKRIVWEILALDDAGRGRWGALEMAPEKALSNVSRVLRGWARERLMDKPPEKGLPRRRRWVASPILDRLFARPRENAMPGSPPEMWGWARRSFIKLLRGGSLGPRQTLNMLVTFDIMMHPAFEHTALPAAVRDDEALVTSIHEDVAEALAGPIARDGAPLFAMQRYGPISARVCQRIEASLFDEMERALKALTERVKSGNRSEALEAWVEASYVRSVYRRVGTILGPNAARAVWPQFAFHYGNFGVALSEKYPRMRPLAHTIFKCLHGDSLLFEDHDNAKQQAHNMNVTSGAE